MARKAAQFEKADKPVYPDDAPKAVEIPPCPPRGPLGDLTPEVIEWTRVYKPKDYTRIYLRPGHERGPRKPGLLPVDAE